MVRVRTVRGCPAVLIIIVPRPCPHGKNHVAMVFSKSKFPHAPGRTEHFTVDSHHVGVHCEKLRLNRKHFAGVITSRSLVSVLTVQNGIFLQTLPSGPQLQAPLGGDDLGQSFPEFGWNPGP